MRKLLLTGLLAASFSGLFAQKLDEVQEKFSKGKYDEAKEKIDKILADPKNANTANAWYWKGKVYTEFEKLDSNVTGNNPAGKTAFEAFKKYQVLDQKNIMMTLEQNLGLFQLYDLHYNRGIKFYNAKDYNSSFEQIKFSINLQEYIAKKGFSYNTFSFPLMDTQLINLAASAAYLAKREDEAIPYWERLADAKINDKEYKEVYSTLAAYYINKNDQQKADKYLSLGKELFPDGDFWISLEFGDPGKSYKDQIDKLKQELNAATTDAAKKEIEAKIAPLDDKYNAERFARYEVMTKKYPTSYALAMDYAIELFNYAYANDKKPADYAARQERAGAWLVKSIALNPNSAIANYVMGQHVYNQIYDLEDDQRKIKGTTAADVAKRKEFTAKLNAKYEELYPYSLKAYELYSAITPLKGTDKVNLRKSIDQLIDYHDRKKQADKVTFYQTKLKGL